jgi:hypothetical protein
MAPMPSVVLEDKSKVGKMVVTKLEYAIETHSSIQDCRIAATLNNFTEAWLL